MKHLRLLAASAAALALASCSDQPTAPSRSPAPTAAVGGVAGSPTGTATIIGSVTGTATNTLGETGTFSGTAQITSFATDAAGDVVANVQVTGSAVVSGVTTAVSELVVVPIVFGECPILALDIGAIHLDLLGLVVDLAPVSLDIVAEAGPGNLLGNLLCAVAHLLDGPGAIIALLNLLDLINDILG